MKYCLAWNSTGDSFLVDPVDEELSEWYAEQAQANNSRYTRSMFQTDLPTNNITKLIEQQNADFDLINSILPKFKIPCFKRPNWYDQWELNELHKQWVILQLANPKFDSLLFKIDKNIFDAYHRLNRQLHQIEGSFKFQLRDINLWRTKNPFEGKSFPTGIFNVSIVYTDHGRSSMEKFINYDENPNNEELGSWKTLGGNILVNLVKPYTKPYPLEFIEYCNTHNLPVQDIILPFGNLTDCRNNLTKVRELMVKNYNIENNHLSIEAIQ